MLSFPKESRQTRRFKKRVQDKAIRAQSQAEQDSYKQISYLLDKVFPEDKLTEIAYKCSVIERKRELTALAFVGVLFMGSACNSTDNGITTLKRMCLMLRKYFSNSIFVKPQALQKKINTKNTALFIKEIMSEIIAYKLDKILKKNKPKRKGIIASLYRILLQDSTVISLPPSLKRLFRGCGGAGSEAGVKCDFIIDQSNHAIVRVKFIAGRIPDATMSPDIIKYLEENDLVIRDLGYYNLSELSRIVGKKANFISRFKKNTNVYLNKEDREPINLIEHLKGLKIDEKEVDMDVYIGSTERIPVRILGIKVPEEVAEARRQKLKNSYRKREHSEEMHEWNGYTLMITNISRENLSLKMLIKLYKIRWQIELFFKNMKSNLNIDNLTGKDKYRILCLIYIKIAITWIVTNLYAYAQSLTEEEVSLDQFTKWLKEEERLKKALVADDLSDLLKEIERDLDLLCKQKRKKRKSTRDDVEETYASEIKIRKAA
jgi:hypothetical protein